MRTTARKSRGAAGRHSAYDRIGLRGGIEVMLKNAFTGEVVKHGKGENVVLYIGRNMLMTRAIATASQTNVLQPVVVIGSGTTATQATHTGPLAYFTFKGGTLNQTTASDGAAQPMFNVVASWDSTELTDAGFNSVQEFLLFFGTQSTISGGAPFLNRYLSASAINATTSNQLLVTFSVSF